MIFQSKYLVHVHVHSSAPDFEAARLFKKCRCLKYLGDFVCVSVALTVSTLKCFYLFRKLNLNPFLFFLNPFLRDYFKDMDHLSFVRLNRNQLSDKGLPKGVFNISTLLDLQLSYNQINSIPAISSHLEHLHLNHNHIESKPPTQSIVSSFYARLEADRLCLQASMAPRSAQLPWKTSYETKPWFPD